MSNPLSQAWYTRLFKSLLSDAPLDPRACLEGNALFGLLLLANAVLMLFGPPFLRLMAAGMLALAMAFCLPWVSHRDQPESDGAHSALVTQGVLLCLLPIAVFAGFAWVALSELGPGKQFRLGHAPGLLALSVGYGLRLLAEHGTLQLRPRVAAITGLVLGGLLDVCACALIVVTWSRFTTALMGSQWGSLAGAAAKLPVGAPGFIAER